MQRDLIFQMLPRKIGKDYIVLAVLYKSDYLRILMKGDMMNLQFSKHTVLKVTCESVSVPDSVLNEDSEIAALKFGLQGLGRKHKAFSGRAKFESRGSMGNACTYL